MANEREPGMVPWDFFFSFKGRITRAQYWLDYQLPVMTSAVLMVRLVEETSPDGTIESMPGWVPAGVLLGFGFFGVFGLAASVKRWHDRDMSGWCVLIALIPVFGPIVAFIVLNCLRGTRGANRFGADPLAQIADREPWTPAKRRLVAVRTGLAILLVTAVLTA